ncbi:GntR family transcriptional regulator [Kribbella deserti]|uniref:GntR family transcriptional regulator n=1 Tax=Kribbella deserti TaxID=1926257 RepID=A0ABV6QJC7_9ACTN
MPAYVEIAETLAEEITAGTWPPGTLLPTHKDLQARFNVSRITITSAIDELGKQGMVYSGYVGGRRGIIVRSIGRTDHYATDSLRSDRGKSSYDAFSENAKKVGRKPSKRFEMRMAKPPVWIADRLGIPHDQVAVIRISHQILDGEPWARETSYYALDLAQKAGLDTTDDLPQGTIRALADAGFEEIARVDEVTDESAGPADAADLAVPVGAPLLVQTRTAASSTRITRVSQFHRLGRRNRLIWEVGNRTGLDLIRAARESGKDV